jgi:hypothetical protein
VASKRRAKQKPRNEAFKKIIGEITITVTATEEVLGRLANIMLYSVPELDVDPDALGPLPFDEPAEPDVEIPEDLYPMVRQRCGDLLQQYGDKMGFQFAKGLLAEHGYERLSLVPDDKLGNVLADLEHSLCLEKGERMI